MRFLVAAVASLLLAPLAASAGSGSNASAAFTFGRSGGNIAPFTVAIARNGSVSAQGAVRLDNPRRIVSADARAGMLDLARAEGFFSLPKTISCPRTLPDVASFFVSIKRPAGTTTVSVHGSCKPRFNRLYALINAVAGVTT
jgi:hypothetical protein